MCERKANKDAPAAVVSCAACMSRAPPADASRPALSGWGRPAWSLRVFRPLKPFGKNKGRVCHYDTVTISDPRFQ